MVEKAVVAACGDVLEHLRRARDLADQCFAGEVTVERLAAAAGLSRFHFLRLFAATYGVTPGEYVSRRRIERAQDLLRCTGLSVTEVCHAVGFSSLGSFTGRFRALVGETPGQFQARYAGSDVPRIPGCVVFMWGLVEHNPNSAIQEKPQSRAGA